MCNRLQLSYSLSPKTEQYTSLISKVFEQITFDGDIYYDDIAFHAAGKKEVMLDLLRLTYIISNQKERYNALVATLTNTHCSKKTEINSLSSINPMPEAIKRSHFNVLGRILILPDDTCSIETVLSSMPDSPIIKDIEGFANNDISYEGDVQEVYHYLNHLLEQLNHYKSSIEFIMKTSSWSDNRDIDFEHN